MTLIFNPRRATHRYAKHKSQKKIRRFKSWSGNGRTDTTDRITSRVNAVVTSDHPTCGRVFVGVVSNQAAAATNVDRTERQWRNDGVAAASSDGGPHWW